MDNTFKNLLDYQLIAPINDIKQITLGEKILQSGETLLDINTMHLVAIGEPNSAVDLVFKDGSMQTIMIGNTMIYDAPVQDGNPILAVKNVSSNSVHIQYDMSS